MDPTYKFPGSPGTPLFQVSPERANRQQENESPTMSVHRESKLHSRESSVHEKVAAFNTLAFQGKQLERKTNDAALKRAMLGREEAESEMRRYRDDTRALRRQVEEGRMREIKVSERLESVIEKYGQAKETYAHTRAAFDKEIRKFRKEAFKSQSSLVKLQEELKASRDTQRMVDADLEHQKERTAQREQEAFAARYELVGVQEEVTNLQERIKLIEQERDALRTIAESEQVARIAAEGRMPLPRMAEDDEFASPKKARRSVTPMMVTSSAASEEELEDMRARWEREQWRADRAHDRIEFLELECRMHCCESRIKRTGGSPLSGQPSSKSKSQNNRPSTVFIPEEGVFRRISPSPSPERSSPWISPTKKSKPVFDQPELQKKMPVLEPPTPEHSQPMHYARTPSCEPPAPAIISDANTSLLSLFDAPHSPSVLDFNIPTMADPDHNVQIADEKIVEEIVEEVIEETVEVEETIEQAIESEAEEEEEEEDTTVIQTFKTISTTTRIPLANPPDLTPPTVLPANPAHSALTPTMSREEALAQIRERRGRARSLAQGTMTPRKQMVDVNRRDISAPAIRSAGPRGRSQARVLTA